MKIGMVPLILFFTALAVPDHSLSEETRVGHGRITVTVSGLRSDSGLAAVNFYGSKKGFPDGPQEALVSVKGEIKGREATVTSPLLPFGEYAVSVLHDENGNGKMDFNRLNMPVEGFGASNNPKSLFGPPSFDDARFSLESEEMTIRIEIGYLF